MPTITPLGWIGIIILFNSTLLGGASQLGDLALSSVVVKAILAVATLGNGFLGGLVTMFSTSANMVKSIDQGTIVKAVRSMPGVEDIVVNAKATPTLAAMAVDPSEPKISPIDSDKFKIQAIAKNG